MIARSVSGVMWETLMGLAAGWARNYVGDGASPVDNQLFSSKI